MPALAATMVPAYGIEFLVPRPGPLGRLIRRRRIEMELTQSELSDLTEQYGDRVPQNLISRLESGKSQRVNDVDRLGALGKALGLESDEDFILAAYAPASVQDRRPTYRATVEVLPPGPEGELIMLIRDWPDARKRRAVEMLKLLEDMDSD